MINELILLPLLCKFECTQYYTRWNIIFSLLAYKLNISPKCLLMNSISIWAGFQHGLTDGAKLRLIKKYNIKSIYKYLFGDILYHVLPIIIWFKLSKGKIKNKHLFRNMIWHLFYIIFVAKSLHYKNQYCEYKYKRKLFSAIFTPWLVKIIWNRTQTKNKILWFIPLIYIYYMKEVYDLYDEHKKNNNI